jgi:hypothetical protein
MNTQIPASGRADAFAEAIDRLHRALSLAPDPERVAGVNFAIGVLTAMRDRAARTTAKPAAVAPAPSCSSCRRPFDLADTRYDGRAQYRNTPWCCACVDRCHESEIADHRCPICYTDPFAQGG